MPGSFGSFRHLAVRFFGALDPRGPSAPEERWALDWLLPGEQDLWRRMSGPDRRHAAGVARDTATLLAPAPAAREVMAAALLHDVGKVESGLGTIARVGVTVAAIGVGRDRLTSTAGGGVRGRVRDYLIHDQIGASLCQAAGSHPTTIAWAREHHLAPDGWTVERTVADALKEADGD
ncbi:MAG TPA: hypothetical protein VG435_10685 [Acidimicrobiales bacterium]|jgi:hypothetical protein|nr:hypothetical protein [Acidimicrobiales bacterium]